MKYIWEESDIIPGVIVKREIDKEEYMIGWMILNNKKYKTLNALGLDGLVLAYETPKKIVDILNSEPYIPLNLYEIKIQQKRL